MDEAMAGALANIVVMSDPQSSQIGSQSAAQSSSQREGKEPVSQPPFFGQQTSFIRLNVEVVLE